ncbi:MAG: hypothetical protein M3R40_10405 [Pseudomonadota bacterium]|nr:hypothetical protein [Pseudomonadota bacterium]
MSSVAKPRTRVARADLNLLVGLRGRERTENEYRTLLGTTGFRVNAVTPAGPTSSIVEAVPAR